MRRFREVPTFGLDTIRKFSNNVSSMKRLAARDFEDILQVCHYGYDCFLYISHILQCIIPVIEGLLSEKEEKFIFDLLFLLATWHAYAKLRLHTDNTLNSFEELTKPLGDILRKFGGKFSDQFDTQELPKEADARRRREAKNRDMGKAKKKTSSRAKVRFNLSTYKLHALGDYANTIRRRGTTDSYSTQMVRVLLFAYMYGVV